MMKLQTTRVIFLLPILIQAENNKLIFSVLSSHLCLFSPHISITFDITFSTLFYDIFSLNFSHQTTMKHLLENAEYHAHLDARTQLKNTTIRSRRKLFNFT